jgi:hypothetical protein
LTLLVLLAFIGCDSVGADVKEIAAEEVSPTAFNAENVLTVEFDVPDMMCPDGCGVAVEGILSKQPGAKDVLIDFENKKAIVVIEEGKFDSDKALAALVDKQFTNSSVNGVESDRPPFDKAQGRPFDKLRTSQATEASAQ